MTNVLTTLKPELIARFLTLATDLSPENLSCDGELSEREVSKRRSHLMNRWRELEKEAGRKVSEDEIWAA